MASENRSLDGNRDNWATGRVDPDGLNWLAKYQGKNFERNRRINEYIRNEFKAKKLAFCKICSNCVR
jgi:hypothetical protein